MTQDLEIIGRQGGRQVDGGRSLANAALLICDCDDFSQFLA